MAELRSLVQLDNTGTNKNVIYHYHKMFRSNHGDYGVGPPESNMRFCTAYKLQSER